MGVISGFDVYDRFIYLFMSVMCITWLKLGHTFTCCCNFSCFYFSAWRRLCLCGWWTVTLRHTRVLLLQNKSSDFKSKSIKTQQCSKNMLLCKTVRCQISVLKKKSQMYCFWVNDVIWTGVNPTAQTTTHPGGGEGGRGKEKTRRRKEEDPSGLKTF